MCDEVCALAQLNAEELAWAAGFFDGEGSTFVQGRAARPRYLRLGVSATQRGHGAVPPVLLRLQTAMLGMGEIQGPNELGVYKWRTRGFEDGQAVIALLWPYLGLVKRAQARSALRQVAAQYGTGLYVARRTRARVGSVHSAHTRSAAPLPAAGTLELAWAGGFLDAEGCFGIVRARSRKRGGAWYRIRASASQHGTPSAPPLVLLRLRDVLGIGRIERHGDGDDYRWCVEDQARVEAVIDTVRPWLGARKLEQARRAIVSFAAQVRLHGTSDRCARGHVYTHVTVTKNGRLRRYCNACARITARAVRARAGIPPRQFRNVSRRHPA